MTPEKSAKKTLTDKIRVTNQMVIYAKAFFLDNFISDSDKLLLLLLENMEAKKPVKIRIIRSGNTESLSEDTYAMLDKTAKSISWRLAGCEAVWGLITSGILIPGSETHFEDTSSISYTLVRHKSGGGDSGGWDFSDYLLPVPSKLCKRFSIRDSSQELLSDPDLYMHELKIEGLNKEMESSLRESVLCFKHELFLGCLALLGRASEGAWIKLGLSLSEFIPDNSTLNKNKLKELMEDPFVGIGKKIKKVLKVYERKDIFEELYKDSGYKPSDLKSCFVWSDVVRDSRNSIHYGVEPKITNSYEKVAALLLGAIPNLKVIYSIVNKCG